MLERLVVLQHGKQGVELDAGLLVEQLLFYGELHLHAGPAQLGFLTRKIHGAGS